MFSPHFVSLAIQRSLLEAQLALATSINRARLAKHTAKVIAKYQNREIEAQRKMHDKLWHTESDD